MSKRPSGAGRRPPFNVDRRQIVLGAVTMVVVTVGGIAWGVVSVLRQNAPEQGQAAVGFAAGVVVGAVAAGGYALAERARRGSFFVDDPAEIERNRSLGRFRWGYLGAGLLLAVAVRFIAARAEFILGGAACGVMLAWTPIGVAAVVRYLRRY